MSGDKKHRKKILFIGGSLNQSSMMYEIGRLLDVEKFDVRYSPMFLGGFLKFLRSTQLLEHIFERTVVGGTFLAQTLEFFRKHKVRMDYGCQEGPYDLVVTCSDIAMQNIVEQYPVVLVQEGMTNPENFMSKIARLLNLPPWVGAGTTMAGESGAFDLFCVASKGYKEFFEKKGRGVPAHKMVVTGIPNFDNCQQYYKNDFPHKDYVLVCTSDMRETQIKEDRIGFLKKCKKIAAGRPVIFKLHPNEIEQRATNEIHSLFPDSKVFVKGSAEEMVANSSCLICHYSTLSFVGLALGKELHSFYPKEQLEKLMPWQNGGSSAKNIAQAVEEFVESGFDLDQVHKLAEQKWLGDRKQSNDPKNSQNNSGADLK